MNTFLRNTISKLYNAVSAPVAATRDALAERLQSVRETTSLLYNRMMENMGYGQQERLKDIVEKKAEEEEQLVATKKEEEQQQESAAAQEEEEEEDNPNLTTYENEEDDDTRKEMSFNSPMIEFSEDSDINDLIKRMLAHIKTQVENSGMPESGFSFDEILGMTIKFDPC